jgi:hypothetical protein
MTRSDILRERLVELPIDLRDLVEHEGRAHEVLPPGGFDVVFAFDSTTFALWTEVTEATIDELISWAETMAANRRSAVHAALASVGELATDDRASIIAEVTADRTTDYRELSGPEARHVAAWADNRLHNPHAAPERPGRCVIDLDREAERLGTTVEGLRAELDALADSADAPAEFWRQAAIILHAADDGRAFDEANNTA